MAIYYFSTTDGNDSRTSTQAQNPSTPWQSITKLNSFFSSLNAGDSVLFKRGDVFYGSITINKSGNSLNPITIGAYGTGNKPIITGFTTVSSWTNLGSNIWESTSAVSTLSTLNMVTVNNIFTPIGRWPNTGYRTITSHISNTSITDSTLTGTPNWTGGEVVIRKTRWIIDRNLITSQSTGTLFYTSASPYDAIDGYGYFIQNHISTLDQQNEWCYNSSSKKISIYSTSTPASVNVSSIDNLVVSLYRNYITFDNLSFTGANSNAFYIGSSSNFIIQNCDFDFNNNGVYGEQFGGSSSGFIFTNNTINHTNSIGIRTTPEFSGAYIGYNSIQNTGMVAGMGGSSEGQYESINVIQSVGAIIEYNTVINSGYIGIGFSGDNVIIRNNYIDTFCEIKDDGGGIYGGTYYTGQIVRDNIVVNSLGAASGTNPSVARAYGIYIDDFGNNVQIINNTVGDIAYGGIFLHSNTDITLTGNTVYNTTYAIYVVNASAVASITTMTGNIFFAKTSSQQCINFQSNYSTYGSSTFDNNYYARPIADTTTISVGATNYNLAGWKSFSGKDANSNKSPISINNISKIRFEYNETDIEKNISLGAYSYIDMAGGVYYDVLSLLPYTSIVLLETGAAPTTTTTSTTSTTSTSTTSTTTSTTTTHPPTTTTTSTSTTSTTTTSTSTSSTTTTTTTTIAPTTTTSTTTSTTTTVSIPSGGLYISPNPATKSISVSVYIVRFGFVVYRIFDSKNAIVYKSFSYLWGGQKTKTIDVSKFKSGVYKMQVSQSTKTDNAYFTKK